ncbi:MAG TPA: tail fiber domain-containing protein [Bacteroidia bacterium]|nr:tail fiber domain-containing protein [Bacteroidia bacterium]
MAIGYKALYSNTTASRNNALGYRALYSNTTGTPNNAFGNVALFSNQTGYNNDAFGDSCMYANVSGIGNAALGYKALRNNTGSNNMAIGASALTTNTSGAQNVAIGFAALSANTSNSGNVGVGYEALLKNTGQGNVGIGVVAGFSIKASSGNTFVGDHAGSADTANYNTGVGAYAGNTIVSGDSNVFVGAFADANASTLHNCSAYGYGATAAASDKFYFGNSKVLECRTILWNSTSDGRFKINVKEDVKGLEFINKLRPVTYNIDTKALDSFVRPNSSQPLDSSGKSAPQGDYSVSTKVIHSGFIAQEVEKAGKDCQFKSSIVTPPSNNKEPYAMAYGEIVVPLVKAVQELSKKSDSLKKIVSKQDSVNQALQNQINQITGAGGRKQNNTGNGDSKNFSSINVELNDINAVVLNQNTPNPFAEQTIITYNIPKTTNQAQILFYDNTGKLIKTADIKTNGKGQLNVFANDLTSGIYSYTLIIDGKIYDTKKMMKQ